MPRTPPDSDLKSCVSSTSFSWSERWQPLLTKHVLPSYIFSLWSFLWFSKPWHSLYPCSTAPLQTGNDSFEVFDSDLRNRLQPREFRDVLVNGLAVLKAGLQSAHPSRLLTAQLLLNKKPLTTTAHATFPFQGIVLDANSFTEVDEMKCAPDTPD